MAHAIAISCCDCDTVCTIRLVLLTTKGEAVYLTACPTCADKKTLRVFHKLDHKVFIEASLRGMPIVEYGRHK